MDLIGLVQEAKSKRWLDEDYTVKDSIALLNSATGKRFTRKIVNRLPTEIKENDFTIEKWVNPSTGGNHFKRRFVDTLLDSMTVKIGYIESYYIYSY